MQSAANSRLIYRIERLHLYVSDPFGEFVEH